MTEKELESYCVNVVVVNIPNIISYITLRCNLQPSRNFGGGDGDCESHDAVGLLGCLHDSENDASGPRRARADQFCANEPKREAESVSIQYQNGKKR